MQTLFHMAKFTMESPFILMDFNWSNFLQDCTVNDLSYQRSDVFIQYAAPLTNPA